MVIQKVEGGQDTGIECLSIPVWGAEAEINNNTSTIDDPCQKMLSTSEALLVSLEI